MFEQNLSIQEQFFAWLSEQYASAKTAMIINNINSANNFSMRVKYISVPFFQISDVSVVTKARVKLEQNKLFRVTNRKDFSNIISSLKLYCNFLYEKSLHDDKTTEQDNSATENSAVNDREKNDEGLNNDEQIISDIAEQNNGSVENSDVTESIKSDDSSSIDKPILPDASEKSGQISSVPKSKIKVDVYSSIPVFNQDHICIRCNNKVSVITLTPIKFYDSLRNKTITESVSLFNCPNCGIRYSDESGFSELDKRKEGYKASSFSITSDMSDEEIISKIQQEPILDKAEIEPKTPAPDNSTDSAVEMPEVDKEIPGKDKFVLFLRSKESANSVPHLLYTINMADTYCTSSKIISHSIFSIETKEEFEQVISTIQYDKIFRNVFSNDIQSIDKVLKYYFEFYSTYFKSEVMLISSEKTDIEPQAKTAVLSESHFQFNNSDAPDKAKTSKKNKNILTIKEAIIMVLMKASSPLTVKQIHTAIIAEDLYTFGAQDPVHVVDVTINTACKNSGYTNKARQILFGSVNDNNIKKYYLLSREKEVVKSNKSSDAKDDLTSTEVRTETDAKLKEKYPVLFMRLYSVMKEYGNISVSAQNVFVKVGKIARISTVKRILDYASWCEHIGENYRYSPTPINYVLPDDFAGAQQVVSGENEFYHWLETSQKLSSADCSRFTSGINVLSRFLKNECQILLDLFSIQDYKTVLEYFEIIKRHHSFAALADNQRERLSSSMRLYEAYLAELNGEKAKAALAYAKAKEKEFRQWCALRVGPDKARVYADVLKFIEDRCVKNNLISKTFFELDNVNALSKILKCVEKKHFPFILQSTTLNDAVIAIPLLKEFLQKGIESSKPGALPKNVQILDFKNIGDLSFTKPVRLRYIDKESTDFSSWADLYTKLIFMLRVDHPRILSDGTSLSGSSSPDISSKPSTMRAPKAIGKYLYVETNQDTRGLVNRMLEALNICGVSTKKVEIQYSVREKALPSIGTKKVTVDSQQMSKIMAFIKSSDNGVSLRTIKAKFPGVKSVELNAMLETDALILINGKYYHKSTIEDLGETAEIILATLQSQFLRNSGYTSAKMLYDELRVRLEDFFFDNGKFDSQVEIYDLTKYLFEKIKFKGNSYVFAENRHIWETEPNYRKSYIGILSNFAKNQNGIMTRDEMIEKLGDMGSSSPISIFSHVMLGINQNPSEKTFLMFDEYRFVLTEACHIDNSFISNLRLSLEELFEGDDYLSFDEIDDYFYLTLPELPSGVYWTAHMIKSVLAFFDVGFFTVPVGKDNDIKVPDAAIVRKNSIYKSFSDILWSEINRDYELPREFSAEEFRQILLRKGFIREREKMFNVHTTVEGDLRYFWTDNNSKVTVSKK